MKQWFVYILECADHTLYTGITTDLERRIEKHNSGRAARYTASRRPVALRYIEESTDRSEASQREYAIKQLSRTEKLQLIQNGQSPLNQLPGSEFKTGGD